MLVTDWRQTMNPGYTWEFTAWINLRYFKHIYELYEQKLH